MGPPGHRRSEKSPSGSSANRIGQKQSGVSGRYRKQRRRDFAAPRGENGGHQPTIQAAAGAAVPPHEVPSTPGFPRHRIQSQTPSGRGVWTGCAGARAYTDGASGVPMMPEDRVLVRMIDHALIVCFRSDQKWRCEKAEFAAAEAARRSPAPERLRRSQCRRARLPGRCTTDRPRYTPRICRR
jgi:hypothetical protein